MKEWLESFCVSLDVNFEDVIVDILSYYGKSKILKRVIIRKECIG